ncbi:carbon-phosphorus lyase [Roseivivax halodurans JCM 10272]|uniref:Carbon-phosphorus lyase n=1 Tax=Roseivivax halodurans JCM 10272 TaxID=1449350 RepID=X7EJF4_9RHOB|nr:phosphonate C-P lyase system protein PhnH [Roseivivax halodurans]ETX16042.1 carbon-phosphorus lyase [Roseivivax halodurans JCM 10272]
MTQLAAGFADPPIDSARAFRIIMQVMARPGTISELPGPAPEGLSPAAAALLLTLADHTTPVHLAGAADAARHWLTFHTGAPAAEPEEAAFAVGTWQDLQPLPRYAVGTPDYPDRSVTLIAEIEELSSDGPRLAGPGIETEMRLSLPDAAFVRRNMELYPQGIDLFLTCGPRLAALPRSTRLLGEVG